MYPQGLTGEKQVKVDVLLAISTGWFFGTCEFSEIHEAIEWFVNESVWTHQLPRVGSEIATYLIIWYPQLEVVRGILTKENHLDWLANFKAEYGDTLLVAPIPQDDYTSIHPEQELIDMGIADDKIISVDVSEDDSDDVSPYGNLPYKAE